MAKKKLFSLILAIVMLFSCVTILTACGEKSELASIKVTQQPAKVRYIEGETFDPTGMKVIAKYTSGDEKEINIGDCVLSPEGQLQSSTNKINISYTENEVTQKTSVSITVTNPVTDVKIKTAPTKTSYLIGEKFDPAGMVLTVTYKSGKVDDVTVVGSSATYSKEALTESDTKIVISYGEYTVEQEITIVPGVFIEAEDGILPAGAKIIDDGTALDPNDAVHYPSGGLYVGDFKADDTKTEEERSMKFLFTSDKAGKGDISFRLASQYLKKANSWTPIEMGDCQFNKLCDMYVNGVKVQIEDTVILQGGKTENEAGDGTLWRLWANVDFKDVAVAEGKNVIALVFKQHDYNDCAQNSFNGKFTANIDSLIVTSADCKITPCPISLGAYKPTSVELVKETVDDTEVPYFVIKGTVEWSGYDLSDMANVLNAAMNFDFQGNLAVAGNNRYLNTAASRIVTVEKGKTENDGIFTMKVDVSSLVSGKIAKYSTHFGPADESGSLLNLDYYNPNTQLQPEAVKTGAENAITIGSETYTLVYDYLYSKDNTAADAPGTTSEIRREHYFGCVGLEVKSSSYLEVSEATVKTEGRLEIKDDKMYIVISGETLTYEAEGLEGEALKTALASTIEGKFSLDLQANQTKASNDGVTTTDTIKWTRYLQNAHKAILSEDNQSFELWIDVTELPVYSYTTHFGARVSGNPADFKPGTAMNETKTLNGKTYGLSVTPDSGDANGYWGCLGLKISEVAETPAE